MTKRRVLMKKILIFLMSLMIISGCGKEKQTNKKKFEIVDQWITYKDKLKDFKVKYMENWRTSRLGNTYYFYLSKKSNFNIQKLEKNKYKNKEAVIKDLLSQFKMAKNSKVVHQKKINVKEYDAIELKTTYERNGSPHTQNTTVFDGGKHIYMITYTSWYNPIKQKGDAQVEELLQKSGIYKYNEYNKYIKAYYSFLKNIEILKK